jgi:hypothetical protein
MQCRKCGIEIADKALICYRCGTATVEARVKPPAGRPKRPSLVPLVAALLVMLASIAFGMTAPEESPFGIVAWVVAGVAGLVAIRSLARRG